MLNDPTTEDLWNQQIEAAVLEERERCYLIAKAHMDLWTSIKMENHTSAAQYIALSIKDGISFHEAKKLIQGGVTAMTSSIERDGND